MKSQIKTCRLRKKNPEENRSSNFCLLKKQLKAVVPTPFIPTIAISFFIIFPVLASYVTSSRSKTNFHLKDESG
ncbi:MAG: hypothetical protein O7C56_00010 [Rickettsia endosymbiont of Ixodes persulcatus]|nr:hypothetical protein [Rickettsia endosymbiont of Ixodes persulcatus]